MNPTVKTSASNPSTMFAMVADLIASGMSAQEALMTAKAVIAGSPAQAIETVSVTKKYTTDKVVADKVSAELRFHLQAVEPIGTIDGKEYFIGYSDAPDGTPKIETKPNAKGVAYLIDPRSYRGRPHIFASGAASSWETYEPNKFAALLAFFGGMGPIGAWYAKHEAEIDAAVLSASKADKPVKVS